LTAAEGAALVGMLANLTVGKKGYEHVSDRMKEIGGLMDKKSQHLLDYIQKDVDAFNDYIACLKMPKDEKRTVALQKAVLNATSVPWELAKECYSLMDMAEYVIEHGNKQAVSDGAIAVVLLNAALKSALYNVQINLSSISDVNLSNKYQADMIELKDGMKKHRKELLAKVEI
jgi:formiminotetrahydrofolate cyclodeaminase